MAYGFGTGVQAGLGATDYSNYLRGALSGAQMEAQGTAAIGQGIQNALSSIGVGVQKYMKNKEEKLLNKEATDIISPMIDSPFVRKALNIPENATREDIDKIVMKQVRVFGAANAFQLVDEARKSAAFQVGVGAIPQTITETVEEKVPTFLTPDVNISAPTSFLMNAPQPSVEDFMQTGKITPQAPAMAIDMVSKQPAAPAAAPEAPAIKPVPKNIEQYFAFNAQTGSLVPTRRLEQDTLAVTSDFQNLEKEKERINSILKSGYKSTNVGVSPTGSPNIITSQLSGEDIQSYNQQLSSIEQQQEPLKNKLIEFANVRQSAADFGKQPDKKPSIEETASNVIDRSLRFAEEVNLDPVDKNQWLQMKTVLKDIPRKATDGEKIAAFVKAYGEIAPIDSSVYFKMKQLFDTTPVITDLGGGNQLVTVGNQSFLIRADEVKPMSASDRRLNNQEGYAQLLILAKNMGVDEFIAKHPPLYNKLEQLHVLYGDRNSFTNSIFPLRQAIAALSEQPATNVTATTSGNNVRAAANRVLEQQ